MRARVLVMAALAAAVLLQACPRKAADACQYNSDCAAGSICRDKACVSGCSTDRDCPTNTRCNGGTCELPLPDGGRVDGGSSSGTVRDGGGSSSSSSSSSSGGGTAAEEETCGPTSECLPGLVCVNMGVGIGSVCLQTCTAVADGGVTQSTCAPGRKCAATSGTTGVCVRMAGRDGMCSDLFGGGVDPLLLCEPGLTRLVDNPSSPTMCACKLMCLLATCPGAACACPTSESCVSGITTSTTQGMCGTELAPDAECTNPFDYPFSSSEYCAIPSSVPHGATQPSAICYYPDFTDFVSRCQLVCDYAGWVSNAACPIGTLCLPASEDAWGPGVRTCQVPGGNVDGGAPVDAGVDGGVDAGWDAGTDAGADSGV